MTNTVKEQILEVRDTGAVNMFDVHGVQRTANSLDLLELVVYLNERENIREYSRFILTGEAEITEA